MFRQMIVTRLHGGLGSVAELGRAALTWWLGELAGLLPATMKTALGAGMPPIYVTIDAGQATLREAAGAVIATLPHDGTQGLPDALTARLARSGPVILCLAEAKVLRRIIELPLSAETELDAATAFEIDRQTPFAPDRTRFCHRTLTRDRSRRMLVVELAVTPSDLLDEAESAAEATGLAIDRIEVDGDTLTPRLEFRPRRRRLTLRRWRAEPWRPVIAAASILLMLGTTGLAWQRHRFAQDLAAEVAARREIGHRAEALRSQIERAAAASRFLPDKRRLPPAIEILDTLSRTLPDDSWVFDLDLTPDEVRIAGFAGNVPGLLQALAGVPTFGAPELRAPVSRNAVNNRDRFELALPVKEGGS
jgi:general secretion pathway protein L